MIYETQAYDFAGLKGAIEQLLEEEDLLQGTQGDYDSNPGNSYHTQSINQGRTFQLSVVNTIIVAVNVIAYFITHYTGAFGGEEAMFDKGALSWYYVIREKEYYRIITSMFMHAGGSHLINNMIVLLFVGVYLEKALGKYKYLFIYFGTGIIAGITSISYNMWKENGFYHMGDSVFSIGASGAIFGIVGAILYIVIINKGRLKEINMRRMIMFVFLSLYGGIVNSQVDQAAHIGGFLSGMLLTLILYRRTGNRKHKEAV
jgi:rhomboid protease GluP